MEMCRRTASINMNNRINLDLNESISRNGSIIDDDSGCISDNVFDRKVIINENDQKIKVKKHTIQTEMDDHHDYDDIIEKYFSFIFAFYRKNIIWFYLLYFTCYNVFFAFAIHRTWHKTGGYCSGVKLLTILTACAYTRMLYCYLLKPHILIPLGKCWEAGEFCRLSPSIRMGLKIGSWCITLLMIASFLFYNAWSNKRRYYSMIGYAAFVFIGYTFSKHRKAIKWNQILWGLTLQVTFGILVLQTRIGKLVLNCFSEKINKFLQFTNAGTALVFGHIATGILQGPTGNITINLGNNETLVGQIMDLPMPIQSSIFAFSSMPVVLFFSFFVSILYYYGIMQSIVQQLGWLLQSTIGTTACESISASGNIFLGMTESPYFVMAAPSALAMSKLLYPETEVTRTSADNIQMEKRLVGNIVANLIAFVSFLAFMDSLIGWLGDMVELPNLSFQLIMSRLFFPVALMLGIEWKDAEKVASLIGLKMVINEFVAYQELSKLITNEAISKRSETIATFALCSFANISSIGIQVGGLSAMAPARRSDLAQLAVRAMITGTMASFMTACVAGMFA
ncbi:hypothetical protein BLOT_001721 [Blomia tropicalis]|nr:hypothetical protein BLOT_001721 [Blomia tropicalis]